jgi:phosphatidylglycerol---prolipoprotein diacylglyceryl transferase
MLQFPAIDPVAIQLGPIALRWYGLAYVIGILLAWKYCLWIAKRYIPTIKAAQVDEFMMWALAGIVIGGRLGYVLIYNPLKYMAEPWRILMTWEGGMSFHGGFVGVVAAAYIFCRRNQIPLLRFGDMLGSATPFGLFLGRIANFINAELYGHPTTVPWAMVFPGAGPEPRHPSQIYEALTEGVLLLVLIFASWQIPKCRDKPGFQMGLFLAGYGVARSFCEIFRVPDGILDLGLVTLTIGQALSIPLVISGLYLMMRKPS